MRGAVRAIFPVSPQVSGAGVRLAALGEKDSTREPDTLYFNLQMSRMEDSSPLPPATPFLPGMGG